ncbi:hypothetical protein AALA98_06470 [Lachnospiraceae bacterium 45-W7]
MKTFFPLSLCFCLCMSVFTGCGSTETDAADSVKAIYDLYILGDTRGISSLGMTDEDISHAQKTYDNSLKEMIRTNFADSGQEIDEDTLEELCLVRKEALAKMSASVEITEETDGRATVVIHTTYFTESSLDADAFYDAREEALQQSFTDSKERQIFLMNAYTRNLITAYRNVTPSSDTTDITVECVIQNKTWVPANMSSFGSDLALAITGHH